MKKNRMMRLASILLVCVLLTTSVISGTFAKYTTSNNASAQARVAYWGFETPTTIEFALFDHNDAGVLENGLLAPGTENEINYEFINSKAGDRVPEVDYKITVTTTGSEAPSAALDAQIVWFYNEDEYADWDDFIAAIEGESGDFDAGELPDFLKNGETNTVGWKWEFEVGADEAAIAANDKLDTALGNAAAEGDAIQVKLAINVLVEQVTG